MENLPLELIDLICTKIKWKILSRICVKNPNEKSIYYRLNGKRLKSYWKWVMLSYLVYRNDLQGVKYRLEYDCKITNKISVKDNDKLHMDKYLWDSIKTACQFGHLEILQYFLSKGLQPFFKSVYNPTEYGLVIAKENKQLYIVRYLISLRVVSPEKLDLVYNIIVQEEDWSNLRGYAKIIAKEN